MQFLCAVRKVYIVVFFMQRRVALIGRAVVGYSSDEMMNQLHSTVFYLARNV